MKKLFTEPDIEILKFLCNEGTVASPGDDEGMLPGEGGGASGNLPGNFGN